MCPSTKPDGKLLVTAGRGTTTLWDLTTGEPIRTVAQTVGGNMPGGRSPFEHALVFTPDGKMVIIANNQGQLGYWTVETGDIEWSEPVASGAIYSLAISRDANV